MLMSLFWTLAGLVLSGGGLWIAAAFVPTVAMLLKAALDFLRSPLGTALGVLAFGLFLFASGWIGGDIHGARAVRAAWVADVTAKAKAAAKREAELLAEMKRIVDASSIADDQFGKSIDEKVESHVAQNPDRAECRADRAGIGRLLSVQ